MIIFYYFHLFHRISTEKLGQLGFSFKVIQIVTEKLQFYLLKIVLNDIESLYSEIVNLKCLNKHSKILMYMLIETDLYYGKFINI